MKKNLSDVKKQYEDWTYPLPIDDLSKVGGVLTDPTSQQQRYWPYGLPPLDRVEKRNILVAGCGTNQAAMVAYKNPSWTVHGIDLSESSLRHQNKLKKKHGLSNLSVRLLDLTQAAELGQKFDLIISTGVLHHLPRPISGLISLRQCLKHHGILSLMLYGKSLRQPIYPMQEAFRQIGLKQIQTDVDFVKLLLKEMPKSHGIHRYTKASDDINYDAGIVDTFLHPIDRAYSVSEIFEFIEEGGLAFMDWLFPATLSIETMFSGRLAKTCLRGGPYSKRQEAAIVDGILQHRGRHDFFVCLPEFANEMELLKSQKNLYDGYVKMVPQISLTETESGNFVVCMRGQRTSLVFEKPLAQFLKHCITQTVTIGEGFNQLFNVEIELAPEQIRQDLTNFISKASRNGVVTIYYR